MARIVDKKLENEEVWEEIYEGRVTSYYTMNKILNDNKLIMTISDG